MERELKIAEQICYAFQTFRGDGHAINFSQSVPDATTRIEIYMKPDINGSYNIWVHNDRTNTIINSTPITEIFAKWLPRLVGRLKITSSELLDILTSLLTIAPKDRYFGIRIYVSDEEIPGFRFNLDDLV